MNLIFLKDFWRVCVCVISIRVRQNKFPKNPFFHSFSNPRKVIYFCKSLIEYSRISKQLISAIESKSLLLLRNVQDFTPNNQ